MKHPHLEDIETASEQTDRLRSKLLDSTTMPEWQRKGFTMDLKKYAEDRINEIEHDIFKETNPIFKEMYQADLARWEKLLKDCD